MDETTLVMAEALARSEIEAGVERSRAAIARQPIGFNGLCIDCGDSIQPLRLQLGVVTCLICQETRERRQMGIRRQ